MRWQDHVFGAYKSNRRDDTRDEAILLMASLTMNLFALQKLGSGTAAQQTSLEHSAVKLDEAIVMLGEYIGLRELMRV